MLGTVRDRSTRDHAQRLDTESYHRHTTRTLFEVPPRIAVIGAGISGLMCARTLSDHGVDVTVFEKSRGAGGRMATRRTKEGPQFDHGAQYFTVRDERFERYVHSWLKDGIVAPWEGRICTLENGQMEPKQKSTPRFVGVPGMSAICRHLAADLNICFQTLVRPPRVHEERWTLQDDHENLLGEFDAIVVSAPAPQAAQLLASAPQLARAAQATVMNGCWAAMLSFENSLDLPFDGAFVHHSPLSWVARNNSKPGRDGEDAWVLHASPQWTEENLEADPQHALDSLSGAFWRATGREPQSPSYAAAHRWRYALPPEVLEDRYFFDAAQALGACGDWCSGPRVEGAFLSGMAMAGRVLSFAGYTSEGSKP